MGDDHRLGSPRSDGFDGSAEEAKLKGVYGFDCYEDSNNTVDDIGDAQEALLESAYSLTPSEEREHQAEQASDALARRWVRRLLFFTHGNLPSCSGFFQGGQHHAPKRLPQRMVS